MRRREFLKAGVLGGAAVCLPWTRRASDAFGW